MMLLLEAFAEQMRRLSVDGIAWNAGGRELHSKVYCITSVADAPARASMQNVLQLTATTVVGGAFILDFVLKAVSSTQ
ncbi:unnamed protein product [Ixodes hexagonus]